MEKEFVPYELALRMKELGFDEPCFGYYNNKGYSLLTVMMAQVCGLKAGVNLNGAVACCQEYFLLDLG